MKVYIDKEFKCYTEHSTDLRAIETDFFDGKCAEYIEGYRFVPADETWTREDGVQFVGEMATPWKDWRELDAAQRTYEQSLLAEYAAALETVGVSV